jgi:hypothetical protein
MNKRMSVALAFATLVGCGALNPNNQTLIVLQNPATKQTVQCSSRAGATWIPYAEVESCAKSYEKAGFVRMGGY